MNYKLVAYAADFVSFLIQRLDHDSSKVKQVILFGSVVRGEAGKNSDVDIFIDILDLRLELKIDKIKEEFYESVKVKKYWNLLQVDHDINCSVGKLEEWMELERSMIAQGMVLYGKYVGNSKVEPYYLFKVTPGKNRAQNISGWRQLYGYTQKVGRKQYVQQGLVIRCGGSKLARGVFIIPAKGMHQVILFLRKNRFTHTLLPIWQEAN